MLSHALCTLSHTLTHIHPQLVAKTKRAYVALCTRCAHVHSHKHYLTQIHTQLAAKTERGAYVTLCTGCAHTLTLTHSHNHTQLVAKTKRAYVELQRQFAKRLIKKEYHALVEGCVDGEQVKGSRD